MKCETCGGIEELYCTQCNRKCGSRTKDGGCCDAICKSCNGTGKQPEAGVTIAHGSGAPKELVNDLGDALGDFLGEDVTIQELDDIDSSEEIREALSEYLKKIGWLLDSQIKEGEKKYLSPVSFGYKSATAKAQAEIEEYKAENQLLKNRVRRRAKTLFEMRSRIKELEQKYEPEK